MMGHLVSGTRNWNCLHTFTIPGGYTHDESRNELVTFLTVTLTLIPTSLAFSLVAGLTPEEGLTGAFILILVMSSLGGNPGLCFANAGAVAVLLPSIIEEEGKGAVWYTFMLSGIITVALGCLRVDRLLRLLPESVMLGFVNGLSLVILFAQLAVYQVTPDEPDAARHRQLSGSLGVFQGDWITGPALWRMIAVTTVTAVAMALAIWRCITAPALIGIFAGTLFEWTILRAAIGSAGTPLIRDVGEIDGAFPRPIWLQDDLPYELPPITESLLASLLAPAITISAVALIETLGTTRIVSGITGVKGYPTKTAVALGFGNFVCGAFGSQGGCSEMGLTQVSLQTGGKYRISQALVAIFTLIILLVAAPVINILPTSALAGVMFVIIFNSFDFRACRMVAITLWRAACAGLGGCWKDRCGLRHINYEAEKAEARRKARTSLAASVSAKTSAAASANGVSDGITNSYRPRGKDVRGIKDIKSPPYSPRDASAATPGPSAALLTSPLRQRADQLKNSLLDNFFSRKKEYIGVADALIILVVTLLTPVLDLASAVAVGCLIAALGLAWEAGYAIRVVFSDIIDGDPPICSSESPDLEGEGGGFLAVTASAPPKPDFAESQRQERAPRCPMRIYEVHGPLFYGSADQFLSLFNPVKDPPLIEVHFNGADIHDFSGIQAINELGELYERAGKKVVIRSIKEESLDHLLKASDLLHDHLYMELSAHVLEPSHVLRPRPMRQVSSTLRHVGSGNDAGALEGRPRPSTISQMESLGAGQSAAGAAGVEDC